MTVPPARIRVASYNVHRLRGDRAALRRVVRAIAPDVLCLQEAPRYPLSGHRVAELAQQWGMSWSGGRRGRVGTTILTSLRLDVLQACHRRLPVRRFDEPRGCAWARVRVPGDGRVLTVTSVHLPLRAGERRRHVAALLSAAGGGPAVLAGDVNETAGEPAWRALDDVMCAVGGGPTFPAVDPARRIDEIWVTPGLSVRCPSVTPERVDLAAASDHRPVVVDVLLGGAPG